jgi:hypothetical protein
MLAVAHRTVEAVVAVPMAVAAEAITKIRMRIQL